MMRKNSLSCNPEMLTKAKSKIYTSQSHRNTKKQRERRTSYAKLKIGFYSKETKQYF